MRSSLKFLRVGATLILATIVFAGSSSNYGALAQTAPPAATVVALPEATIRALQEALNKQGIAVKADGVLNDETRAAIRKYQSAHHLPVTGEPDRATLNKLGVAVAQGAAPAGSAPPTTGQGQMQGGMMMNCPMMQGQMQEMMKMMMGMMKTMQAMQGQMQQMQPGQMPQIKPGAK